MRLLAIFVFGFLILPVAIRAQGGVVKAIAGPNKGQFQIVVSLLPETDVNTWKMQSFILTIDPIRKGQQPGSYFLDLATTRRNLDTDEKKQKFLDLRWTKPGDVEGQCADGSWQKSSGPEIDRILETANSVVQLSPVEVTQPIEVTLPKDVVLKITNILNGLETSKLPCVRDGGTDN